MADSVSDQKYGRLFTEADVRSMLSEYLDSEQDIDDVLTGPTSRTVLRALARRAVAKEDE